MTNGISGGFGDDHLEDYLQEQEGLLRWKADGDEDAVQEARIAVWRTLSKHPDATRSYLDQAATWRIRAVQRGESLTGEQRPRGGKHIDPLRTKYVSDEFLAELQLPDLIDAVIDGYHQGEIMLALSELPEAHREYVLLRFWGGLDRNEIASRLHRNPGNLATTWRTQIQPKLAARLKHLVVA